MTLDDLERIAREASDSVPAPWNGRILALLAELRSARAVVEAAEAWRDHRCIPGDSNCYAGDHDSCGYRKVVAQLEDAIDHHRTRKT